ncbi:MAG: hypothetical protein ACLQUY_14745 [Ktedonobacterales bacterium]
MSWRRPVDTRKAIARWQSNREPHIADDRLATFGHALDPVRVAAPELFTARVMARIDTQPASVQSIIEPRLRDGLVVVVATLTFSMLIVLASAGVLALIVPITALMLLGALVNGLVSLFSVGGNIAVWMSSTTASQVMLASLALMATVSLLVRAGIVRYSTHATREA